MMNTLSPVAPVRSAAPRFGGKEPRYIFHKKDSADIYRAEQRNTRVKAAKKGLAKGIAGLLAGAGLIVGGFGLIGGAASAEDNAADRAAIQRDTEFFMVENHLETTPNTTGMTEVGDDFFSPAANGKLNLSEAALKDLDNAYSQIIIDLAQNDITHTDMQSHMQTLQDKKPQVMALLQTQINESGQIDDAGALFMGLTEIFKDDMSPAQYERLTTLGHEGFDVSGFESFFGTEGGAVLGILGGMFGGIFPGFALLFMGMVTSLEKREDLRGAR